MRFSEKTKGSISVFLILILFPLFTGFYLGLLSIRKTAADRTLQGSMNLAGTGALNSYNPTLKKQYGIFAVNVEEEVLEYEISSMLSDMIESNGAESSPLISLTMNDFTLHYPGKYSLYREEIMKQQMMEYMKYRGPVGFADGISKKLHLFFDLPEISGVMKKREKYYDSLERADKTISKTAEILSAKPEDQDIKEEKDFIKNILKSLPDLEKELSGLGEKSDEWNEAIKNMDNGNLKNIFKEDFKNGGGIFAPESTEEFRKILEGDLSLIEEAEKEGGDLPPMEYKNHGLYKYLSGFGSSDISDENIANAKKFKENLSEIAGNRETVEEAVKVSKEININDFLPDDFRHVGETVDENSSPEDLFLKPGKAEEYRNLCFMEEYIYGMFSSAVTPEDRTAKTGRKLNESPLFGCEMEYILVGKDHLYKNVLLVKSLLFQIRFLLNSCYLFSSAEMKSKAMAAAMSIAAVTGLGVRAVQYAILGLWATAETVLDISTLMKGKDVPVYKNRYTWTLSMEGLAEKVKQDATEYTSNGIDDIYKELAESTDEGFDRLENEITEFFDNTEKGITETTVNMIMLPVETLLSEITENIPFRKLSREEIKGGILEKISEADNGSAAFKVAQKVFTDNILDDLLDMIYEPYSEIFLADGETFSEAAKQKIEQAIQDQYEKYIGIIEKKIIETADKERGDIKKCLSEGKEVSKEKLSAEFEKYMERLGDFTGHDKDSRGESISSFTGLGMTYEDYLRIFILLGLNKKETGKKIISRTAEVMQANCSKEEESFDLRKCTVGICLKAEVKAGAGTVIREETYAL